MSMEDFFNNLSSLCKRIQKLSDEGFNGWKFIFDDFKPTDTKVLFIKEVPLDEVPDYLGQYRDLGFDIPDYSKVIEEGLHTFTKQTHYGVKLELTYETDRAFIGLSLPFNIKDCNQYFL